MSDIKQSESIQSETKGLKKKFNIFIQQAKEHESKNELEKALDCYLSAKELFPPKEKLISKIESLQSLIQRNKSYNKLSNGWFFNESKNEYLLDVSRKYPYALPSNIYDKLYSYQREGVKWMWSLFKEKTGGVLGDDMGLGKTVQVSSFIRGLIYSEFIDKVLLILPLSVMANWENELKKWCGNVRIVYFHGSKSTREMNLKSVIEKSGIVLTTYGTVQSNYESLCLYNGEEINWDVIVLDEGHHIKNPNNKTSVAVNKIKGRTKIVLTGTPIMNNLKELWSLFNYCCDGQLLGTQASFNKNYEKPIVEGNMKSATDYEKDVGYSIANRLREKIGPHFLRREKDSVFEQKNKAGNENNALSSPKPKLESNKVDIICWVSMNKLQTSLYKRFLELESYNINHTLLSKKTPFDAILALKNICLHPTLLRKQADYSKALDLNIKLEGGDLLKQSSKLYFMMNLLSQLKSEKHKVLIFSQRVEMLNIIQSVLNQLNYSHLRIDGRIKDTQERQAIVNSFNNDPDMFVLLLTTKVGGVGLNLTSADRVIIYDPSWNLALDEQAVDRAYRIGQKKDVIIYRLLTIGTIEEKIYRRQIFKGSLSQTVTAKSQQHFGYFTKRELKDLFKFQDEESVRSTTFRLLNEMKELNDLLYERYVSTISNIKGLYGASNHRIIFHEESIAKFRRLSKLGVNEIGDDEEDRIKSITKPKKSYSGGDLVDSFKKLTVTKAKTYLPTEYIEKKRKEKIERDNSNLSSLIQGLSKLGIEENKKENKENVKEEAIEKLDHDTNENNNKKDEENKDNVNKVHQKKDVKSIETESGDKSSDTSSDDELIEVLDQKDDESDEDNEDLVEISKVKEDSDDDDSESSE